MRGKEILEEVKKLAEAVKVKPPCCSNIVEFAWWLSENNDVCEIARDIEGDIEKLAERLKEQLDWEDLLWWIEEEEGAWKKLYYKLYYEYDYDYRAIKIAFETILESLLKREPRFFDFLAWAIKDYIDLYCRGGVEDEG